MGAHFLSDTVVGMLIAFIIWTFYDARWKKHINWTNYSSNDSSKTLRRCMSIVCITFLHVVL